MNYPARRDPPPATKPIGRNILYFVLLILGYCLLGIAGLQLQSAQTGVTPLWPASGLAFAMVYWFGLGLVLAILPAMWILAWVVDVPFGAATLSAVGSMLEVGAPAYLMRRFAVDPGLRNLRDALLFVATGPLLGPLLSATAGSLAFHLFGDTLLDPVRLWLLWWLGNSLGFLLLGGFGLVVGARASLRLERKTLIAVLMAGAAVIVITAVGMLQVETVTSPLVFYLLIPVFILAAQRGDQYAILLLGVVAMVVMLLSATWLPPQSLAQTELGILYLDVSLLWVVVFTGMIISSARQEMQAHEQAAWLATHDPLTRLFNRYAFMERLKALLSGQPEELSRVLLLLDLDRFKDLNDAEGHRAGDQVLREIGKLLNSEVRPQDSVARLGGDEFAVILEDCELLDACAIAENIRGAVERFEYSGAHGIRRVEASLGLVKLNRRHATPEDAVHDVETACYAAKRAGRNRMWVHDEHGDEPEA
ncbi:MAG: diguanylate cyclase [Sedimenticolaceae bacterium]